VNGAGTVKSKFAKQLRAIRQLIVQMEHEETDVDEHNTLVLWVDNVAYPVRLWDDEFHHGRK